jgi:glutaredoxin-related protein
MGQETRIRLYGKSGCKQCDMAKDKLKRMGLNWEFIDVSEWMDYSDDWRERPDETVSFQTAYNFYYPMPLPLFRFDNSDYSGYSDGLAKAKNLHKKLKSNRKLRRESQKTEPALAVA